MNDSQTLARRGHSAGSPVRSQYSSVGPESRCVLEFCPRPRVAEGDDLRKARTDDATRDYSPRLGLRITSRHHEKLSQFASRDSLLVGRDFPGSEFRETNRVGPLKRAWSEGSGLTPKPVSGEFPVFSLQIRDFGGEDGFAIDCPHRHLVRDSGESAAGARAGGKFPAISRVFGRVSGRSRSGDTPVVRSTAPQPLVFSAADRGGPESSLRIPGDFYASDSALPQRRRTRS
jgi:hypothetical protein